MIGRQKHFLSKLFTAGTASLDDHNYHFIWTKNLHNVHIHSILKHPNSRILIPSRVSGRGYKIGPVRPSVCPSVCLLALCRQNRSTY